jgi:sugar O-acyltransferase (sialic acid O-acetyltransferase NeuD family)
MHDYVMFGHNHLFGDLVDIIHSLGGKLTRIVQNIEEPPPGKRKSLRERLRALDYGVEVEPLESFVPGAQELYIVGFTGSKITALGDEIYAKFGIKFASLIHPSAIISPTASLGQGCVINAGVVVASGACLGRHVLLNRGSTIGHDTILADYAIVQPGANVAGHVTVGFGSVVGMGANVIEDRQIGSHSVIAAGAVVTKDVPDYTLVAGVPAETKKKLN